MIVGHIPRKIATIYSLFLRRNGIINVEMTGGRRYSAELPQGGLEILCTITFEGVEKDMEVKNLISAALTPPTGDENLLPDKRRKKG